MKAKTLKAKTTAAAADALRRATADGFRPTLALVFLSIKQDRQAICQLLKEQGVAIFGATTAGEFIDGDVEEGTAVVMLMEINPSYFRVLFQRMDESNSGSVAKRIGESGKNAFRNPAFLVSYSGLYIDGETIVRGIEETAGNRTVIFGGMAGDDLTWSGPCVFTNEQAGDKALIAVVIDGDKIDLKGHAASGWKPVGTERKVTKSSGSVVYTIDEEPALDVVMKFLGISPEKPEEINQLLTKMSSHFPILMLREDGAPVVRTSMFANVDERSIKFSGNVPQGAAFRFALPPDFEVVHDVIAQSAEVKNDMATADALVLFSCVARHVTLGPMISDEIDGLKNLWGAPLIGFFSYGEIGKITDGGNEFHNNTCCLVAIKEKAGETV